MRLTHSKGSLGLLVLTLLGCPKAPPPSPRSAVDAGADGGTVGAPVDAGPKPIPGARLTARTDGGVPDSPELDAGDAGERIAGSLSGDLDLSVPDASVPDWARLTFSAQTELADFRARLVGSDGQMVPSHSEVWVADGGTQVEFTPADHWPTRGCCRLVVDGQIEKLPTGSGSRFLPFEVSFAVDSDSDRPPPRKLAKRRHRHRRQ